MLTITMKNPFQKTTFKEALKGKSFNKSNKTFTRPNRHNQRCPPLPRIEEKPADMEQSNHAHTKITFCYQERSETYWYHEPTGEELKQMKAYEQHYASQHCASQHYASKHYASKHCASQHYGSQYYGSASQDYGSASQDYGSQDAPTDEQSYASTQKKGEMDGNSQQLDDLQEQHTITSRKQQGGINLEYLFGADLDISTCLEDNIDIEEAVAEHKCTFHTSVHQKQHTDCLGIIEEADTCQIALRQNKQSLSYLNAKVVLYITSIIDFLTSKKSGLLSPSQRGQLWALLRVMGSNFTNYCIMMMGNLVWQYNNAPEHLRSHYQLECLLIKQRLFTLQQMSQGNFLCEDTDILLLELQTRL